jgi:hypothetical protein
MRFGIPVFSFFWCKINIFHSNKKEVFKLTITKTLIFIQGLLGITLEPDPVYMHLLERAPFNIGHKKHYEGIARNLVAHVCRVPFQQGFHGFVGNQAEPIHEGSQFVEGG